MKTDRLVSIVMLLLEHRLVNATRLAALFGVTTRTIYRDMEAINLAGIPIYACPGVNGGFGIMEGYKVDRKLFTPKDFAFLLSCLQGVAASLPGAGAHGTMEKVRSLIPADGIGEVALAADRISIDLSGWIGRQTPPAILERVQEALEKRRILSFNYRDGHGRLSRRRVEPYRLVFKEAAWYLQGYCLTRRDARVFKLSRITELHCTNRQFEPRDFSALPMDGSGWISRKLVKVSLLADPSLRERLAEICGEENITTRPDGRLLARIAITEDERGYGLLLGFGDGCECLEPARVRTALAQRIAGLARRYGVRTGKTGRVTRQASGIRHTFPR